VLNKVARLHLGQQHRKAAGILVIFERLGCPQSQTE
jgi:hypothetical protein